MMRYALSRIEQDLPQLDWNVNFECFCIKARNFIDFLTGRRSSRTNFDAHNFAPGYRAPPRQAIQTTINQLDTDVVHTAKSRPSEAEKKITLERARKVAEWVESAIQAFVKELPEDKVSYWNAAKADPSHAGSSTTELTLPASPASATNAVTSVSSRPTDKPTL
jgi:hypothetical protein